MKKSYIVILVLLLLLGVVCSFAFNQRAKKVRLERNQHTLLTELEVSKTKNGTYKAEIGALQLTNSELKKYGSELCSKIKNLDIKVKKLQSVSQTATRTVTEVKTVVRDSLIYDTIKADVIDYKSKWVDFYAIILNDSLTAKIESRDSLIQAVYDDRSGWRKFWRFWENPKLKQVVSSSNPNCKIHYSEYIEITNKKGK